MLRSESSTTVLAQRDHMDLMDWPFEPAPTASVVPAFQSGPAVAACLSPVFGGTTGSKFTRAKAKINGNVQIAKGFRPWFDPAGTVFMKIRPCRGVKIF
jgi:hypothetical protein